MEAPNLLLWERGMWKDDLALYSSFFLSSHQHPAGSNGFIPNFCQSPILLVLFFCRMETGIGLHREPETPGLSFGLEAQGGVGCAVLAKSCLVSGKLSLDCVILHSIAFPKLLLSSSLVSLLPWVD